jgi:hypothetical protein
VAPYTEDWLLVTDLLALFHRNGWLRHPGIFRYLAVDSDYPGLIEPFCIFPDIFLVICDKLPLQLKVSVKLTTSRKGYDIFAMVSLIRS